MPGSRHVWEVTGSLRLAVGTHVVRMEGGVEDPTKMVNSCEFPNFAIPNFGLIGGSLLKNLSSQISLPGN